MSFFCSTVTAIHHAQYIAVHETVDMKQSRTASVLACQLLACTVLYLAIFSHVLTLTPHDQQESLVPGCEEDLLDQIKKLKDQLHDMTTESKSKLPLISVNA